MAKSALSVLHASYKSGKLRVLVGAGSSIGSGFPTWDELCLGLLERYLSDKHAEGTLVAREELSRLARGLLDALGRDAAGDFVRLADPEQFHLRLAQALYRDREIDDLPILSLHSQLAALARGAKSPGDCIYTTNYDPMIELAIAYTSPGVDWRALRRSGVSIDSVRGDQPLIHHVHGWIDPDGESGGTVVLTETHYLELQAQAHADPNQVLARLLHDEGALLVVGMSLSDPNLRRLFYWRKRDELRSAGQKVFVVLKRRDPVLDGYLVEHWRSWKVNIILVDSYDEVPGLLRKVQWGEGESPPWLDESMRWLVERTGAVFYQDGWQEMAYRTLKALREQIEVWFSLPAEEKVNLAIFVPGAPARWPGVPPTISTAATSRRQRTGDQARAHAELRRLSVEEGGEQGVAGVAFATGTTREVLDDGEGINLNFSPDMIELWDLSEGYREWRSVLAIPVLDSPSWLPVAVVTVTSSFGTPFWTRFGEREPRYLAELEHMIRRAAKWLLVDYKDATKPLGERVR
jgi:hypothetical protein